MDTHPNAEEFLGAKCIQVLTAIEMQTDNPAKIYGLVKALAKVHTDEWESGTWRALVELPARAQDEVLDRIAAFTGEGFRSIKVPRERAAGVLESGGGPLDG